MLEAVIAPDSQQGETLASRNPSLSTLAAVAIAREHFGLHCREAAILTAERDQNLLLRTLSDQRYVMKVSNPAEQHDVTSFQTGALCHIEMAAPEIPIPRVCRTLEGRTEAITTLPDGRSSTVRVLTYLDGVPLYQSKRSRTQRVNLARCLARIDLGLGGFEHPGQAHYLQWDITHLERLEPLLTSIDDDAIRGLVEDVISDFRRKVRPALSGLRKQVIYNDLNFYNILVSHSDTDEIAGIIDFGDIVAAPLVNDLAVATSYQFGAAGNRGDAAEFISAYHRELPLTDQELMLLPTLIEARLALTLLITSYRAKRYPENSRYILRNNPPAREALLEMRSKSGTANREWVAEATEARG